MNTRRNTGEGLTEKYHHLLAILKNYRNVAVAYSGGVDSTLLAYAACEALGAEHVLILHACSSLLSKQTVESAEQLISRQFSDKARFRKIPVEPLQDSSFRKNDHERCYICKKLIYSRLREEMAREEIDILLDGTNCDDLLEDRPGHRAIEELGIRTPLVEAGYRKKDIRFEAARLKLENAALPSNSCLATRIEPDKAIQEDLLLIIERLEHFLEQQGIMGSRVRPRDKMAIIQISESDFKRLTETALRRGINTYFREHGYDVVALDLTGRS